LPASLPYLASNRNVGALFANIASAAIPPKFTNGFLQTAIGLKGTNDRQMIPLLRNMGFLDQSNTPTATYALLKARDRHKLAIADGVRRAYAPLFTANEGASELSGDSLKSLVAQIAGTDDDMTARIAGTFAALVKHGDFKATPPKARDEEANKKESVEATAGVERDANKGRPNGLRAEFQYVIQVQLPSNGTEETYLNIFNAIRKTFQ
jgi:hypothetical protein